MTVKTISQKFSKGPVLIGLMSLLPAVASSQTGTFESLAVGAGNTSPAVPDGGAVVGPSNVASEDAKYSLMVGSENFLSGSESVVFGNKSSLSGRNSFSVGSFNTLASATNSFSVGSINSASGQNVMTLGTGLINTRDYSIVLGKYNQDKAGLLFSIGSGTSSFRRNAFEVTTAGVVSIPGTLLVGGQPVLNQSFFSASQLALGAGSSSVANSFSIGNAAIASREGALALGNESVASGLRSVAMATGEAKGEASLAVGRDAVAHGTGAIALGGSSEAFANYATAMGSGKAIGFSSFANGSNVYANTRAEVALGANNIRAVQNVYGWVETDPIFSIGNSETRFVQSNAITIRKNGETTLTNKFWNPSEPLAVNTADNASGSRALVVEGHTLLKGEVILESAQGDISMGAFQ